MTRVIIDGPDVPKPLGPYSPGVMVGDLLFSAGQIGVDASGVLVTGGAVAEFEQAVTNLKTVLRAADLDLADVVKVTLFLVDLDAGAAINVRYAACFSQPYPARSTVQVAGLPAGAQIEIEAVARRPT